MLKTIKNWFIAIGIVSVGVLIAIIGRKSSNRSGVSGDTDYNRRISDGDKSVKDGLKNVGSSLAEGRDANESAYNRSINIETKLRAAREILERAKER